MKGRLRPLAELGEDDARKLAGLVFDLDDTVLDGGTLGEGAYSALFRLRESGLRLLACTGRPARWGELIARQWPVDAVIAENGAVAFARDSTAQGRAQLRICGEEVEAARVRRAALAALADELCARFPATALADDNDARFTDVALDIGEHRRVQPSDVAAMRMAAAAQGVRTIVSSVHLHLTREADDKASGTLRAIEWLWGDDPARARLTHAFVGDSGNDASAFAAFDVTFGVANVRAYLSRLTVPPRFVTDGISGAGFAEIGARLVALREAGGDR